jgi:hypothetical protein
MGSISIAQVNSNRTSKCTFFANILSDIIDKTDALMGIES